MISSVKGYLHMESIMLSMFGTSVTRKATLLYFEGNVGSGKTEAILEMKTMLKKNNFKVYVFAENVERWLHDQLLQDMYDQPANRAAKRAFEALGPLKEYIERLDFIQKHRSDYDYILIERHPTTTLDVFSADQAVKGLYQTINKCYPSLLELPSHTVNVKTTPSNCLCRVRQRGRDCERNIKLDFIQTLDQKHNAAMQAREQGGRLVFTVDANRMSAVEVADQVFKKMKI
jgi:thymidylate kinase